jgi:hypothetical protein
MDEQNLVFKGILLEDDKTVGDYGINKGSTVDLISLLSVIPIFVRTSEEKKVPLLLRKRLFVYSFFRDSTWLSSP